MTISRLWQSGCEQNSLSEFFDVIGAVGYAQISNIAPKTGTYGLKIVGSSNANGRLAGARVVFTATSQLRLGFFHRHPMPQGGYEVRILTLFDGSANQLIWLTIDSTGSYLQLWKAGPTQVGSNIAVPLNTYYHVGLDIKKDASAGWIYLYLDGNVVASTSGNTVVTTIAAAAFGSYPGPINGFSWQSGLNSYYDDMFIDDTSGESAPVSVPRYYFTYKALTGTGYYNQLTGTDGDQVNNYLLLNEIPPDSATGVIADSTGLKDSYAFADYTSPINTRISAVIPIASALKTDAVDMKLLLGTRLNSVDLISSGKTLSSSQATKLERQTTKPGGGSWTDVDVNNAEVVVGSDGTYT